MSCIHLPAAHIAAIVAYAVRTRPGYEPRYEAAPGVWKSITRDNAAEVAAILAQANANAYAERYRETPQPVTVTPPMIHNARALRPVELLKACHGYDYQTSDWSDYDTSAAHVRASVDQSLRALRTDHLDLLLIHRPDALQDFDELADVFASLRRAGKVRNFGVSNFAPHQLAPLHRRLPLATHQIELSPLQRSALHDGVLDQCQDLGLRPMIWSPLAGGRIFTADDARARRLRATLEPMAAELGVSVTTLVIAWVLRHPSQPLPILGSRRIEVARDAMAARTLQLDAQRWSRIWMAATGHDRP